MISAICTLTQVLAVSAYVFAAFVFPITIPVGCAVFQYLIIWTYIAVVVFVISILIFPEEAFLGHRTCVREQWSDTIIYEEAPAGSTPVYLAYGICGGYATYNVYKKNMSDDPKRLKKGYSIITVHGDSSFDYGAYCYDYNSVSSYIVNSLPVA